MKITKVKHNDEGVLIKWTASDDRTSKETVVKSRDEPAQEFTEALQGLARHALDLIDIRDTQWAVTVSVIGMSVTYQDDESMGVVITLRKDLDGTNGPLILNTPYILDDSEHAPTMSSGMLDAVDKVLTEATRYLNGHRAQADWLAGGA